MEGQPSTLFGSLRHISLLKRRQLAWTPGRPQTPMASWRSKAPLSSCARFHRLRGRSRLRERETPPRLDCGTPAHRYPRYSLPRMT